MGGGGGNRRPGGGNGAIPNRNQNYDSNGPDVRIRGSAYQVYEKYMNLAQDANTAGDRIMAESYYQHAEHYYRIIGAIENGPEGQRRRNEGQNGGYQYQPNMQDDGQQEGDEQGDDGEPQGQDFRQDQRPRQDQEPRSEQDFRQQQDQRRRSEHDQRQRQNQGGRPEQEQQPDQSFRQEQRQRNHQEQRPEPDQALEAATQEAQWPERQGISHAAYSPDDQEQPD